MTSPWEHPPLHANCIPCLTAENTKLQKRVAELEGVEAEVEHLTVAIRDRDAQVAELEAAGTRAQGEVSTNEFWADGMRVGKALGFKNGVEAASKGIHVALDVWSMSTKDERSVDTVVEDAIRALAQRGEGEP
jgi:hypothetical protein